MKNSKIAKLKADRAKQYRLASSQQQNDIKDALVSLYELINGKEAIEIHDRTREVEVKYDWEQLIGQIKAIRPIVNIQNDLTALEEAIEKNKPLSEVKINNLEDLIKAIEKNKPLPIKIEKVDNKSVAEAINKLSTSLEKQSIPEAKQQPEDFIPYRRVVLQGKRFFFDDQPTPSRGGGGGGSGGGGGDASASNQISGAQKTQIVDSGGEAATVTGGKLDVNASVDTTGLALDATLTDKSQFTKITDGTDTAEVNTRTDGIVALEVNDDMTSFEPIRQALVASTDTTFTFAQAVRLVRVKNESLTASVFVRDGAISSDTPANAEMVGVAPAANLPTTEYYPNKSTTVHLRSAGTPTVSVTGFY